MLGKIVVLSAVALCSSAPRGHATTRSLSAASKRRALVRSAGASLSTTSHKMSKAEPTAPLKGGATSGLAKRLEVGGFFALWYALNVWYNVENKKTLKAVGLPWSVSLVQLMVGSIYACLAWATGLRAAPADLLGTLKSTMAIAVSHGAGQACTVISLGAGKVSSTHVVKALEPLFSAVISVLVFGKVLPLSVYGALGIVVSGVALAVAKDVSFSALSFGAAMASNALFACRAVFSKRCMTADMSAANLFGVVTIGATLALAPVALAVEGAALPAAVQRLSAEPALALSLLLSGLFHYLNNEVMYMTLSRVDPVTLAVGNTVKRVVIIAASLIAFREPMTQTAALGAGLALGGTLLYSLLLNQNK